MTERRRATPRSTWRSSSATGGPTGCTRWPTVLQRIDLADRARARAGGRARGRRLRRTRSSAARSSGSPSAAGVEPRWRVRIDKRIPVAAGLGGGSADAAAALRLANATLAEPLAAERLARARGARSAPTSRSSSQPGPQLVEGAGERLRRSSFRRTTRCWSRSPNGAAKPSTGEVFRRFDELDGAGGFAERRAALPRALAAGDLAALPPNDLGRAAAAALLPTSSARRARSAPT